MIRHLLKLVWNRKRTHALIMLEIFCSFLVVFAILASVLNMANLYRQPLGYDYENVWAINVDRETGSAEWSAEEARSFRAMRLELETMPQIVAVAATTNYPFSYTSSQWGWGFRGRDVRCGGGYASAAFPEVLDLEIVAGRWYGPEDDALAWEPVVIDRRLAELLYGDEDPLGQRIDDDPEEADQRVVGVISAFRRGGHFDEPEPFMWMPAHEESDEGVPTDILVARMLPDTPAVFEQELLERLQAIAHGWTLTVEPLSERRRADIQTVVAPLAAFGVVAGFLLIMVVLGLTGVMWQNVTRRTREIGLRRAAGAWRASIHRQIVAEVMITAFFGVALGTVLAIQAPLVGPFAFLPLDVAVVALVASGVLMLLLAALCGLYPGWSATRIQPAEALHYE